MLMNWQKRGVVAGGVILLCLGHAALIMAAPLPAVFVVVAVEMLLVVLWHKPEFSIVLFAVDSFIKNMLFVPEFLGFNPTILFFGLSLVFLLAYFIREHRGFHFQLDWSMACLAGFLIVLILGNFYTQAPSWALEKSSRFLVFNSFALLAPLFFVGDPERLKNILLGIVFSASIISAYALASGLETLGEGHIRLSFFAANPIAFAQLCALCLTIILFMLPHSTGIGAKAVLALPVPILILAVIFSNSNGPVFALLLTVVLCLLFISRMTLGRRLQWLVATLSVFIGLYALLPSAYVHRFAGLVEANFAESSSVSSRLAKWDTAMQAFTDSPIVGVGTGGFAALTEAEQDYPHNLILELLSEHGLIGFACMAGFVGLVLLRSYAGISDESSMVQRKLLIPIFAGTVFLLLAAQTSGSLLDLRLLFVFLGMLLVLHWERIEDRADTVDSTRDGSSSEHGSDHAAAARSRDALESTKSR